MQDCKLYNDFKGRFKFMITQNHEYKKTLLKNAHAYKKWSLHWGPIRFATAPMYPFFYAPLFEPRFKLTIFIMNLNLIYQKEIGNAKKQPREAARKVPRL